MKKGDWIVKFLNENESLNKTLRAFDDENRSLVSVNDMFKEEVGMLRGELEQKTRELADAVGEEKRLNNEMAEIEDCYPQAERIEALLLAESITRREMMVISDERDEVQEENVRLELDYARHKERVGDLIKEREKYVSLASLYNKQVGALKSRLRAKSKESAIRGDDRDRLIAAVKAVPGFEYFGTGDEEFQVLSSLIAEIEEGES